MIIGKAISPFALRKKSSGGGNDPDAQLFITATGISGTNATAINQLVINLKAANIWTKMKAIYPMVGLNSTTYKFNLKNPIDSNAAYRLAFFGGGTFSANGYHPGGVNGYADTFLNSSLNLNMNNAHLSYYSRTQTISTTQSDIGNNVNAPPMTAFIASTNTINVGYYGDSTFSTTQTISDKRGFVISSRTSPTSLKLYNNGSLTNTQTGTNTTSPPNLNLFIGARNNSNTADVYSTKELAFASIGDGLTDAEALAFYNAVQTFNTTLGRQV